MNVFCGWWKTAKDHEGILLVLARDPAGNVSDEYLVDDSTEQLTMPFSGFHHSYRVL